MNNKINKMKYDVGDIVSVKGYQENFIVEEWFLELHYHMEDGLFEHGWYTLRGLQTDSYLDTITDNSHEITLIQGKGTYVEPLSYNEIDILLDKYNQYREIDKFLNSIDATDDSYSIKANEIINYLNKITNE